MFKIVKTLLFSEPPPAHAYVRKYLLPQQPSDFYDHPVAAPAAPISHSPGIHISSPAPPNPIAVNPSTVVQSKPLDFTKTIDLGHSDRHRNATSNSPRQIVTNDAIPLDVPKNVTISKSNEIAATDLSQRSIHATTEIIKIPTIITTPDTVIVSTPQANPSNSIKTHEIDDTSNSSNNSKSDNSRIDVDVVSNGTTNDVNKAPASSINQQTSDALKNPLRTNSADGFLRSSSTNSSPVPSPSSAQSAPATPVKFPNEFEKSSSPGKRNELKFAF